MEQLAGFLVAFWNLAADLSLYLLLACVLAGLLRALVPEGWVYRQLGTDSVPTVLKAAFLGTPLPLCSCGVLPVAAQLKAGGASRPALLTFLVATPLTGVGAILATYSLMGGFMTVVRLVASLLVAMTGGLVFLAWTQRERKKGKKKGVRLPPGLKHQRFILERLKSGQVYAFTDVVTGIARPMLFGLLLGAAIVQWMPAGLLGEYSQLGPLPYLLAIALGVPLHVSSTGSVPIAAAMVFGGLSPGAALAFLIAGPATNSVALAVARDLIGKRGFWIYLAVVCLGALFMGLATDLLAFGMGVTSADVAANVLMPTSSVWSAISMVGASVMLFLLAYRGLAVPLFYRLRDNLPTERPHTGFPTVILRVPEAECSRCSSAITATLQRIDQVRSVNVDLERRLVTVELRASCSSAALVKSLAHVGYDSKVVAE